MDTQFPLYSLQAEQTARALASATHVHGLHSHAVALLPVSADEIRWDGSEPVTTHKIRLDHASYVQGHDVFAHVQVQASARASVRWQRVPGYNVDGVRGWLRVTGADDTGERHSIVLGGAARTH